MVGRRVRQKGKGCEVGIKDVERGMEERGGVGRIEKWMREKRGRR